MAAKSENYYLVIMKTTITLNCPCKSHIMCRSKQNHFWGVLMLLLFVFYPFLECNTLYPDKCAVCKHGAAGRQFTDSFPPDADLPSGGICWITGGPNSLHKICRHAAVLQNVKRTRTKQRYVCMMDCRRVCDSLKQVR